MLVELTPETGRQADAFYDPLFQGSMRLWEDYSDDRLAAMLDFLERGREMVEGELAKLEQRLDAQRPSGE